METEVLLVLCMLLGIAYWYIGHNRKSKRDKAYETYRQRIENSNFTDREKQTKLHMLEIVYASGGAIEPPTEE